MMTLPAIEDLVCHRPPALMLDRIVSWTGRRLECAATIRRGPYTDASGRMRPIATLEPMAQAVAAYERLFAGASGPRPGYLVGVADLALGDVEVRVGDRISVEAARVYSDETAGQFATAVRRGADLVAEARLTVYRATEP
jgi:predicted hotdog family 3-hydroxylacyl-ACP dehydratase